MSDLDMNFRNIGKILSLLNPKEKGLIDRLRKELIQIKKAVDVVSNVDSSENDIQTMDSSDSALASKSTSMNLYGESKTDLEEMSSAGGGAVAGGTSGAWAEGPLTEEEDMMNYIESIFTESKLFNAFYTREYAKNLLKEEQATVKVNKLTGMNKLEKFLRQNIKSIKESYMDLTTDKAQRASFKAHLLKLLSELLETLFVNVTATPQNDPLEESASINFQIDDHDGDDGKIVDIDGDGKPDEPETIPGMDETGKREAVAIYNKLEKQIGDPDSGIFANLSNDLDRKVFSKWLLINLSKHMDKWESLFQELDTDDEDVSENNELAAV